MKTNRNIYFAAAITGGRMNQPHYAEIVEILEQYGTVFSKHVADKSLGEYGETDIGKEEIHARELERLTQSDIIVAEVTTSAMVENTMSTLSTLSTFSRYEEKKDIISIVSLGKNDINNKSSLDWDAQQLIHLPCKLCQENPCNWGSDKLPYCLKHLH